MFENRALSSLFVVFVGLEDPEDTPEDEVSERLMNDFSIKSTLIPYLKKNSCFENIKLHYAYKYTNLLFEYIIGVMIFKSNVFIDVLIFSRI